MSYAVYTYRCRQCGDLFESSTESGEESAFTHLTCAMHKMSPIENQPPIPMLRFHECSNDKVGVADLAGYHIIKDTDEC